MSHKRWQALRLKKLERKLREFSTAEQERARTYQHYASLTDREIPREIRSVVTRLSTGTIRDTAGALAVLYTAQKPSETPREHENVVESLEERFRTFAAALAEEKLL